MRFGLTLPNRGVLFGATTAEEMLRTAEIADQSGMFHSVWVGDSLFGKPRMESITLLSGVAARTKRVRLGAACMASFTLRDPVQLAYQWASLDLLVRGTDGDGRLHRHRPAGGRRRRERVYGVDNKARVERLTRVDHDPQAVLDRGRRDARGQALPVRARHRRAEARRQAAPADLDRQQRARQPGGDRAHAPPRRPARRWLANLALGPGGCGLADRGCARKVQEAWAATRTRSQTHLYHNINVNEDQEAALAESKQFLDTYYMLDYPMDFVAQWTATGSPDAMHRASAGLRADGIQRGDAALHELESDGATEARDRRGAAGLRIAPHGQTNVLG